MCGVPGSSGGPAVHPDTPAASASERSARVQDRSFDRVLPRLAVPRPGRHRWPHLSGGGHQPRVPVPWTPHVGDAARGAARASPPAHR